MFEFILIANCHKLMQKHKPLMKSYEIFTQVFQIDLISIHHIVIKCQNTKQTIAKGQLHPKLNFCFDFKFYKAILIQEFQDKITIHNYLDFASKSLLTSHIKDLSRNIFRRKKKIYKLSTGVRERKKKANHWISACNCLPLEDCCQDDKKP